MKTRKSCYVQGNHIFPLQKLHPPPHALQQGLPKLVMRGRKNHLGIYHSQNQAGSVGSTKHGAELHVAHRYCTLGAGGCGGLYVYTVFGWAALFLQQNLSLK